MLLATVLLAVVVEGRSGPAMRTLMATPDALGWCESVSGSTEVQTTRAFEHTNLAARGPADAARWAGAVWSGRGVDRVLLAIPPPARV